jgi:hypothetical protein
LEAKGKTIHSEIAIYARSAFANGYAKHTELVTDEAKSDCVAAMQYAIEHVDNENVMKIVEQMGSLAGLKALSKKIK